MLFSQPSTYSVKRKKPEETGGGCPPGGTGADCTKVVKAPTGTWMKACAKAREHHVHDKQNAHRR